MKLPISLPLRIVETPSGFGIVDSAGIYVCYFYGDDEPGRAQAGKLKTVAEAKQLAQTVARALTDLKQSEPD